MGYRKEVPKKINCSNFIVMFDYIDMNNEMTAVMAICGKRSRSSYLIPLSNAYMFADSISGEPTDHLLITVRTIAESLNLGNDRYIYRELADAVVDALPELIQMPPPPTKDLMKEARKHEAVVKVNGETLIDGR